MRWLRAGRWALATMVLATVVVIPAAPAVARESDRVGIRVPSGFTVAGSAGSVTVSATRREGDCVRARMTLGIGLAGLRADQVRVQVARDGRWQTVDLSDGESGVATSPVAPERERLCKKKSATLRFRVAFLDGAPAGTATFVGVVTTAGGDVLGQRTDTSRVTGGAARPSATPSASVVATVAPSDEAVVAPAPGQSSARAAVVSDSGGLGLGWVVILFGVGMVGIGVALLVFLLRRNGTTHAESAGGPGPELAGGYPPGSYRAGGYPPAGRYGAGAGYPPSAGDQTRIMPSAGGDQIRPMPSASGDQTRPMPSGGGDQTVIMPRLPRRPGP